MDDELKREWYRWLCGKWVLGVPKREGTYALATLDGTPCNEQTATVYEKEGVFYVTRKWEGYFWSLPNPPMPMV